MLKPNASTEIKSTEVTVNVDKFPHEAQKCGQELLLGLIMYQIFVADRMFYFCESKWSQGLCSTVTIFL